MTLKYQTRCQWERIQWQRSQRQQSRRQKWHRQKWQPLPSPRHWHQPGPNSEYKFMISGQFCFWQKFCAMFPVGTPLGACQGSRCPPWRGGDNASACLKVCSRAVQDWLGWSWGSRCGVSICIMLCSIVSVWSIYQLFRAKESPSAATANTQLNTVLHYTALF